MSFKDLIKYVAWLQITRVVPLELAVSHKETAISFLRTPVYTFVYRVTPRATHREISS
jgi:hypothetical protein